MESFSLKKRRKKERHSRRKERHSRRKKEEQGEPLISLYVEHGNEDIKQSIYLIKPTHNNGRSKISPVLSFPDEERKFLNGTAAVNLGSKIYFLGGFHPKGVFKVQAFDTNNSHLGLQSVASLNAPKQYPCVFVADSMIYALGSPLNRKRPFLALDEFQATGCFERYDPISDSWQVLPDPPEFIGIQSSATVVGRRVFIRSDCLYFLIFNLDSLKWDPCPSEDEHEDQYQDQVYDEEYEDEDDAMKDFSSPILFPYGSLYAEGSLYYIRGEHACNLAEFYDPQRCRLGEPLKIAKIGPLPDDYSPVFDPDMQRIVAQPSELVDPDIFFNDQSFDPWRFLFHMGGRIFCYVVTAQLVDLDSDTIDQPHSRGVWIKFFEEVGAPSQFRTLASFCYEIQTNFVNGGHWVRCSVSGSVPRSWIKDPPGNKVRESVLLEHKVSDVLAMDTNVLEEDSIGNDNLLQLLKLREQQIANLAAELSRKDEDLRAKEAEIAKFRTLPVK